MKHRMLTAMAMVWLTCATAVFSDAQPPTEDAPPPATPVTEKPDTSPTKAVLSRRVVRMFDFEERDQGNYEDMPRHWYRIHQEGFPRYTLENTAFDNTVSRSGQHSLKFDLNGGSAGAVLETGALAAVPGANYIISAQVRTAGLRHARAMVVGYFTDDYGRVIDQSIARTPLILSNKTWKSVRIELSGKHKRAAWIVLQLLVLQPGQFPGATPPKVDEVSLAVTRQDITGQAWFDDVAVYQLPRIQLATQTSTNVIRQPDVPRLSVEVRDLTGQQLSAQVKVYDHAGQRVAQMERQLGGGQSPSWVWQPKLPGLGWYWADLEVHARSGRVGRRLVGFVHLPEKQRYGHREADRFAIVAEDLPTAQRRADLLPDLLDRIGSKAVTLSVWHRNTVVSHQPSPTTPDPLVRKLVDEHYQLTLCLHETPQELALIARTDVDDPLALLAEDTKSWKAPLEKLLIRYSSDVSRWQIGKTGSSKAFWRDDLATLQPKVMKLFRRYIADPAVILPWSAQRALPDELANTKAMTMHLPTSVLPEQIPEYVKTWPAGIKEMTIALATLSPERYNHDIRAEDLALRLIHSWKAQPDRIAITRPWSSVQADNADILPDPLLSVWTNVTAQLAERRFVRSMDVGKGIECYVLEGNEAQSSSLVVWNRAAPQSTAAQLELFLGENPKAMDIWGNATVIQEVDGRHHVPLTTTPLFIHNINVKLARMRAAFRLVPNFAESRYKVHKHELVLTNPWSKTLSGRLRIDGLENWRISPRLVNFTVPGDGTVRVPLDITFPMSELAGDKRLVAQMEFDADQFYKIKLSAPLEIGLRDIVVQASAVVEAEKSPRGDVVVSIMVSNNSEKPVSLFAFATAAKQPRQERALASLQPGDHLMKKFRFTDCATELRGTNVRVGLREMEGPAMLNKMVYVP